MIESAEHKILISIIILTHHRLGLVQKCLESIWSQDLYNFQLEIIAMINGHDDETLQYFNEVKSNKPNFNFELLESSAPVGEARNKIIAKASGEYLCFIDDDIVLPENYFLKANEIITQNPYIDVFGGPDETTLHADEFQMVLGEVMKSFWAMGPTALRHRRLNGSPKEGNEINLILCNLWIKTKIFKSGLGFPKDYIRNEENVLLAQIKNQNYSMLYIPDFYVYHERKNSIKKLMRANFYSGMYRTIGFFDEKESFSYYFLIPQILIIFSLIMFVLKPVIAIFLFVTYMFCILYQSLQIKKKLKSQKSLQYSIIFFLIYNFIYSFGLFAGYKKFFQRSRNEEN